MKNKSSKIQQLQQEIESIKQQEESLLKELFELQSSLEGKVLLRAEKWNTKTIWLKVIYYKRFFIDERGDKKKIYHDNEQISCYYEKPTKSYQWRVSELSHKKGNKEIYYYPTWTSLPALKEEWTIKQFYKLADYVKVCSTNLIESLQNFENIDWIESQGEHQERCNVLNTVEYLDIPHIVLTQEECWLVGNSVFLNHNCFLLTKNSLDFLNDTLKNKKDFEDFAQMACRSVGESWRNVNYGRFLKLKDKIEEAYIKQIGR